MLCGKHQETKTESAQMPSPYAANKGCREARKQRGFRPQRPLSHLSFLIKVPKTFAEKIRGQH